MSKTIEELEKELHNAKASLSYHKNKGKPKGNAKPKGESPRAKANRLAGNIAWNDNKRAMAHVIALLTTENDAGYTDAYTQAYLMPVDDARELTKGHEAAVEKQVKVLQEKREARKKTKEPQRLISTFASQEILADEHKWEPLQPLPVPVKKTIPKSRTPNYGDSEETCTAVPVKKITLRLAIKVVSAMTGFEGLSNEQVVGHILNRYLQYNKEKKI
jgi:hypothetical protein